MGLRKPKKKSPTRAGSSEGSRAPVRKTGGGKNRADARRARYHRDTEYAENVKLQQRERYREQQKGRESALAGGLLREGVERELRREDGSLFTVEAFTMREAAEALGRTIVTLKKWVEDQLIPTPVLTDAIYGYDQYSRGEIDAMVEVLVEHESTYAYLRSEHTDTVEQLHRKVRKYRRSNW